MKKRLLPVVCLLLFHSYSYATVYYVSPTGNNGAATTWATAKTTIQGAINVAANGDVILVKYGSYTISTQITVGSKNLKITSDDGTANSWESASPDSSQCILTGNNSRIFYFDNSAITSSTVIRGFKITNGLAPTTQFMGGGICIKTGADPTIEHCWITANYACKALNGALGAQGGGIYIQESSPIIRNNLISGNVATTVENTGNGGGIATYSGSPVITGNIISGNYASQGAYSTSEIYFVNGGGGISISLSSGEISGNVIKNNVAAHRENFKTGTYTSVGNGGGIYADGSTMNISNNIFVGNQTLSATTGTGGSPYGGAIYDYNGNYTLENNTFYDNKLRSSGFYNYGSQYGQGICCSNSILTIKNNIFSNHSSSYGDGRALYIHPNNPLTINNNCFYNNSGTNTNVTSNNEVASNPLLTNPAGDDFTLQSNSPCLNAGDPASSVPAGGEPVIDIGANEHVNISSGTVNSLDNTFTGNTIAGKAFSIAAESGTINCTAQLHLSEPLYNPESNRTIGRYWDISSTGNASLRLYYAASATTGFTGSPVIFHYNGSNWEALATNAEQTEGVSKYVESTGNITSWSLFTVGDSNDPMPVELIAFSARATSQGTELHWNTATEVNNYGFEIQRSEVSDQKSDTPTPPSPLQGEGKRGGPWTKAGFVNGSGTSNAPNSYSFTDKNVKQGKFSYRLQQIDLDGKFSYSNEIEVSFGQLPMKFSLEQNYPNPFNPATEIRYQIAEASHVTLKIFDALGREAATLVNEVKEPGRHTVKFNASSLASGMYFARLQSNGKQLLRKMLLMK